LSILPPAETTPDANGNIWYIYNRYTYNTYLGDNTYQSFVGRFDPTTGVEETFSVASEAPSAPSSNSPQATGGTINATVGIDFVGAVAAFTPQTPIPTPGAAYQATVDWGDGTTSSLVLTVTQNAIYDVTSGHTYQKAGTYSIKVTIGNYNPANPLGDNPVTVFSTANVNDPFDINV
jgi:hypothetical protein